MERRNAKIKGSVGIVLGGALIIGILIDYIGSFDRVMEMTFLSNTLTGSIVLIGGILLLCGKSLPHFLYLDCASLMIVVALVCGIKAPGVTYVFPSVIFHLFNPLMVAAYYIIFCGGGEYREIPTALVFPALYYAFMIFYGGLTDKSVYIYFDTCTMSASTLITMFFVASAITLTVGAILVVISRRRTGFFRSAHRVEKL